MTFLNFLKINIDFSAQNNTVCNTSYCKEYLEFLWCRNPKYTQCYSVFFILHKMYLSGYSRHFIQIDSIEEREKSA